MILANGCPKSGTHALMRILATMGLKRVPGVAHGFRAGTRMEVRKSAADPRPVPRGEALGLDDSHFMHAHVAAGCGVGSARVITILRDPRNVIVSYCRSQGVDLPEAVQWFQGRPFIPVYRAYLGWCGVALILRYEDIAPNWLDRNIDLYSGAAASPDTWTGAPSDWRKVWTDGDQAAWREAGGEALVVEAGYA